MREHSFELGIRVPDSLEGWTDFFPRYTTLPWLQGEKHQRVQTMRDHLRIAFNRTPIGSYRTHPLNRLVHELMAVLARWRLDHVSGLPMELWLKNAANRWFPPVKSKVEAHQLATEAATC